MAEGSLRASAPGEMSGLRNVSALVSFNTPTVDIDSLEAGDVVVRCWVQVITAFNAVTTNVITVGDGTTPDKYLNAADVTEGTPGVYPTGGKGPYAAETQARTLRVTYSQTGTAATTGQARVYAGIINTPE